jgi:Cu2+-exporting ATPase
VVALALLLVSALSHLADAGQLPWRDPWNLLATPWVHALVATAALVGPGRSILVQGARAAWAGIVAVRRARQVQRLHAAIP